MELLQRILVVDGHAMVEAGLRALVADEEDIEVLGQMNEDSAEDPDVGELIPQLLLVDRTVPGADEVETMAEIKRRYPGARVLVIVAPKADDLAFAHLAAGANGCIRKDATHAEFLTAIRSVLQGDTYVNTNIAEQVVSAYPGGSLPDAGGARERLTPRERDVLKLVAAGKSSRCIAKLLCVSVKTVGKHRANLMAKLDLHNAAGLTAYAIARGLK